jgi:hypothetical protein
MDFIWGKGQAYVDVLVFFGELSGSVLHQVKE